MATPRGGLPWIWVSWIVGLLAGEQQCEYAAWFKSHYRYEKRPDETFDTAAWTADHTALVRQRSRELVDDGWRVRLENENAFRLKGAAAILSGKPDIVAFRDGVVRIVDGKTGQQRDRDYHQVLVYLLAVPKCWPELKGHAFEGEVFYRTGPVPIGGHELTPERIAAIGDAVKRIAASVGPEPVPSPMECARCDLAGCAARIESAVTEVAVPELF